MISHTGKPVNYWAIFTVIYLLFFLSVALTVLILIFMLVIMVILVNILIAQLSYRYERAKQKAIIQYDIDKALIVTRIENSRFKCWVS